MTCVLSMTAVYSSNCPGYTSPSQTDNLSSPGHYDYGWLSAQGGRLPTDTGTTTCPCRFDGHLTRTDNTSQVTKRANKDGANGCENVKGQLREVKKNVGVKRKHDTDTSEGYEHVPPKRISPFLNTPKERKEERRKVLKISVQKFRQMEDPEHFLRRSVLINNTLKKVQKEIRDEKQKSYQGYKSCIYRLRPACEYNVINNSYLNTAADGYVSVFEEQYSGVDQSEKFVDEITDTLVRSLEESVGGEENSPASVDSRSGHQLTETSDIDKTVKQSVDTLCTDAKEQQVCGDMDDVVFNNLIRALGEP